MLHVVQVRTALDDFQGEEDHGRQSDTYRARPNEARGEEERRGGRLGLSDRAHRGPRRRRYRVGGNSVGANLWGHTNPLEVTMEEMLVVCKAVRRGVARALVSCDFPFGPLQEGTESAVRAAIRLVKEGGADMVKLDGASEFPDAVRANRARRHPRICAVRTHPQTALRYGSRIAPRRHRRRRRPPRMTGSADQQLLEAAGASLLDFTNSGPAAGSAVVCAVSIPVIGGFGGGPWLDGRIGSHTPRSAMGRNGSMPKPRPTPTLPRSASMPSRR